MPSLQPSSKPSSNPTLFNPHDPVNIVKQVTIYSNSPSSTHVEFTSMVSLL
jgi:hypothetical protein